MLVLDFMIINSEMFKDMVEIVSFVVELSLLSVGLGGWLLIGFV